MKKILLLITFLLAACAAWAGISDDDVRGFFPQAESLPGGAELWLSTGVNVKQDKNYSVYTNSYTYYSGKSDTLLSIVRKKQYRTDVAVYSYNNFVDAADMFKQLTDDAPKKSSQMVRFGERGLFFIFPKSGYINDADFYLVFINRTFVVWMHADDGFAIMDVANPVNIAMQKFIADNPKIYMTKALHVQAEGDGFDSQMQTLSFTTDYPASIKVTGRVFDKKMRPQKGVKVTIKETGDETVTDDDGNYSKTILLDGIKDIELSANFYLAYDKAASASRYDGGMAEAVLKTADGDQRTQLWKLDSVGDEIYGTAYIKTSKGMTGYPLTGKMLKNGQLNLTLDCSNAGTDFKCSQSFSGKVQKGSIAGKWTGTGGGGTFTADTDKYTVVKRKVVITKDMADMKTYVSSASGYVPADGNALVIAYQDGKSYAVYVKPDMSKLGLDNIMTVGAKLVMTHMTRQQEGDLSVFAYDADNSGNKISLGRGKYAGQVTEAEEPYPAVFDISSHLDGGAFILASLYETGNTGRHVFAGTDEGYDALKPYFEISEYAEKGQSTVEKPFTLSKKFVRSSDLLGDKNKPGQDGTADICFSGVFSNVKGRLTSFQLDISDGMRRVYNTDPGDIYPIVGIEDGGVLLNRKDGSVDMALDGTEKKYDICVNGSYIPDANDSISYKYTVDGSQYEGLAE